MVNSERGEVLLKVGNKDVLFIANFYAIMKIENTYRAQGRPASIYEIVSQFLATSSNSIPPISDLVIILHSMCQDPAITMEDVYLSLMDMSEDDGITENLAKKLEPILPALIALLDPKGNKLVFKEDPKEKLKAKEPARKNSKRVPTSGA